MKYSNDEYQSLANELKIDRDSLDEECITQPNRFFHASEGYTLSVAAKDKKKLELELMTAKLDREIRDDLVANKEKITDKIVEQEIIRDEQYQRASREYIEASLTSNRWNALKEAYRQRADMLKVLQSLHSSGYFGEITGAAERNDARRRFNDKRSV